MLSFRFFGGSVSSIVGSRRSCVETIYSSPCYLSIADACALSTLCVSRTAAVALLPAAYAPSSLRVSTHSPSGLTNYTLDLSSFRMAERLLPPPSPEEWRYYVADPNPVRKFPPLDPSSAVLAFGDDHPLYCSLLVPFFAYSL